MGEIGVMELRGLLEQSRKCSEAKINMLVYGGVGVGKTTFCRTAALPIIYHSFDPGGHIPLTKTCPDFKSLSESGNILVFNYEDEDPADPQLFTRWQKEIKDQYNWGAFNLAGTFILDSVTTFGTAIMNHVMKMTGKVKDPRAIAESAEFEPAKNLMMMAIRKILQLPCNVIVVAHEAQETDPILGILRTPAFVGKQRTNIPLLFSEVYHMTSRITDKGFVAQVQTVTCQRIMARTRLGGHVLGVYEPANLREMCKKAGVPLRDKKSFLIIAEEKGEVK